MQARGAKAQLLVDRLRTDKTIADPGLQGSESELQRASGGFSRIQD